MAVFRSWRPDEVGEGGTVINLTVFYLLRLSVDLDFDYSVEQSREEMLRQREKISEEIRIYMAT